MAGMFDDLIPGGGAAKGVAAQAAVSPQRKAALDALSRQLATTRNLYNKDFKGAGIGSVMEYLPTQASSRFNSAAAGLSDQSQAAFRVPGVGAQSDKELQSFISANQPSSWDMDGAAEQKLSNIEGRLIAQRRALGLPDNAPPLYPAKGKAPAARKPMPGRPQQPKVIDFNDLDD